LLVIWREIIAMEEAIEEAEADTITTTTGILAAEALEVA